MVTAERRAALLSEFDQSGISGMQFAKLLQRIVQQDHRLSVGGIHISLVAGIFVTFVSAAGTYSTSSDLDMLQLGGQSIFGAACVESPMASTQI